MGHWPGHMWPIITNDKFVLQIMSLLCDCTYVFMLDMHAHRCFFLFILMTNRLHVVDKYISIILQIW